MVVRDISHTQWTAYCRAAGYSAQSQADHIATCAVVAARGDFVDGGDDGGGEDAVDGEKDPRGHCRIDAGELEDRGHEQRVERRDPGGGSGVSDEGVGVAVAGDEGAGDAAHLPSELEVILKEGGCGRCGRG